MNLQTWAKWVAEIDATTGGATIELRPEAYGGTKICVRWTLGKEQYGYEHALSMTEMRGMHEVVQPCVLEQIANAVRKTMHSAAEDAFNTEQAKIGGMPYGAYGGY